jgi:hypothetical protein
VHVRLSAGHRETLVLPCLLEFRCAAILLKNSLLPDECGFLKGRRPLGTIEIVEPRRIGEVDICAHE